MVESDCSVFPAIEGKSAASFCRQEAARLPDMFYKFNLVQNNKIAKKLTTTKDREKISTDWVWLCTMAPSMTKT